MTKKETIEQFSNIKGIGKGKAELLFNTGFDSLEKIQKASIEELTKIKGINEKLATDIKNQLSNQIKSNDLEKIEQKTKKDKDNVEKTEKTDSKKIEKKYLVKKKPKLTIDQIKKLKVRKQIKKRTPTFLREEWFRYKRIPKNWRRPDGIT